ncbi:hypothetical protein Ddc_13697 [Ditylenchus destructor]|nr:hypothetical protein Ddc_13697 [Ditylenchus destructor]
MTQLFVILWLVFIASNEVDGSQFEKLVESGNNKSESGKFNNSVEEEPIDLIRKFMTEFSALTGPTADVLEHLQYISKNTQKFLQLMGPAGSLAAAAIHTAIDPDSPEKKAIDLLHQSIGKEFEVLNYRVARLKSEIEYERVMYDYVDHVNLPISLFWYWYNLATDTSDDTTIFRRKMLEKCKTDSSNPLVALKWIMNHVAEQSCTIPTKTRSKLGAEIHEVYRQIEKRTEVLAENKPGYAYYKEHKMKTILHIQHVPLGKGKIAVRKLKTWIMKNETYSTIAYALDQVDSAFDYDIPPIDEKGCLQEVILVGNNYMTQRLYDIADIVRANVVQLATFAQYCANITSESQRMYDYEMAEIETALSTSTKWLSEWSIQKLELLWPDMMTQFAKNALGKDDITDASRYNETAKVVHKALIERGPRRYFYQILISENWIEKEWYYYEGFNHTSFCVKDINKINLVVSRHTLNDTRVRIAKDWKDWKARDLSLIVIELSQTLGVLRNETVYDSIVLLHNSKFLESQCIINIGLYATQNLNATEEMSYLEYFSNSVGDAERFKLYFLL